MIPGDFFCFIDFYLVHAKEAQYFCAMHKLKEFHCAKKSGTNYSRSNSWWCEIIDSFRVFLHANSTIYYSVIMEERYD